MNNWFSRAVVPAAVACGLCLGTAGVASAAHVSDAGAPAPGGVHRHGPERALVSGPHSELTAMPRVDAEAGDRHRAALAGGAVALAAENGGGMTARAFGSQPLDGRLSGGAPGDVALPPHAAAAESLPDSIPLIMGGFTVPNE